MNSKAQLKVTTKGQSKKSGRRAAVLLGVLIGFQGVGLQGFGLPLAQAKSTAPASRAEQIISQLDYPELQVVPRASERLLMETREEQRNFWYVHWGFSLPALTTLYTASMAKNNYRPGLSESDIKFADNVVTVMGSLGAAWVAGSVALTLWRPYRRGFESVRRVSGEGRSTELMRERLAEEALEKPARIVKPLIYLSAISHVAVNAALFDKLDKTGKTYAATGSLLAIAPLFFTHRYLYVFEKQMEYKRKIYVPVVSYGIVPDPQGRGWQSGLSLTWNL